MNGNLTTKDLRSTAIKNKESGNIPIHWPGSSQKGAAFVIAGDGKVRTVLGDNHCREHESLSLTPSRKKRHTYSVSHSSRVYTTSTTDTFSSDSDMVCLYFKDDRKERNLSLDYTEMHRDAASCDFPKRNENCYRWLIPRRIYLPHAPLSVKYPTPVIGRNRRIEYVCKPSAQNETIIRVQPRSQYAHSSPVKRNRPLWQGMTRAEYERYVQKRRPHKSIRTERVSRPSKSRLSMSSLDSYKTRIFRSCPSCLGVYDSEGSEYSSSDEDDGGSDTEMEDCERGNDDGNFGDGENSNISDQNESSGGSDSENSNDSFERDYSISSSLYNEDILINEEKAFADIGQFDSDDEFDLEDADGRGILSSDSFTTDSDEFFRDDNYDRGIHYHADDGTLDQVADGYDSDGMT